MYVHNRHGTFNRKPTIYPSLSSRKFKLQGARLVIIDSEMSVRDESFLRSPLDPAQEEDGKSKHQCSTSKYGFRVMCHRRAVDESRNIRLNAT